MNSLASRKPIPVSVLYRTESVSWVKSEGNVRGKKLQSIAPVGTKHDKNIAQDA